MSATSLRGRKMVLKNPLPEGTLPVGVGIGISGICMYGFLSIANHGLNKIDYTHFVTFWAMLFIGGPGFFLPLEQEVGRALAARRANHVGCGPLVLRAGIAGLSTALVLAIGILVLTPATGLSGTLFGGNVLILISLASGLVVYFGEHLTRGTLSGNGRFRAYGILMGTEGIYRVVAALALWIAHVDNPGDYAAVMIVGSVLAVFTSLWGQRGLVDPGPHSTWAELSAALGFLLATSVLTQGLINVGQVAVTVLATPAQRADSGGFQNGVIVARVPLFLFQAVQAALLPKLAKYASTGRHADLRRVLRRLLMLVGAIGIAGTLGGFLLGPFVLKLVFPKSSNLGHVDMGMLAATASVLMIALVLTPALISLHGYWRALVGWIAAAIAFIVVVSLGSDLYGRVERGLLGGAVVGTAVLAALLLPLLASPAVTEESVTDEFADAAIHVAGEP